LPDERGGDGSPSATDFLLYELPRIRDLLASDFEGNTLPADEPPVRLYVGAGTLVKSVALYAVVAADEAVEVIWLLIDRERASRCGPSTVRAQVLGA